MFRHMGCFARQEHEGTSGVQSERKRSHSVLSDSATPWTVACQAPPSMGFSSQEYWSRLTFPSPGDLPDPGIEPRSPTLQTDSLPSEPPGKSSAGSTQPPTPTLKVNTVLAPGKCFPDILLRDLETKSNCIQMIMKVCG